MGHVLIEAGRRHLDAIAHECEVAFTANHRHARFGFGRTGDSVGNERGRSEGR
jgi:hypothetical protein